MPELAAREALAALTPALVYPHAEFMNTSPENTAIVNNEPEERFQAEVDGRLAFLQYDKTDGRMVITHTEVPPELEGQGLGSELVKAALEYARSERLKVVPQCPFAAGYIRNHQEYASLVAE